MSYMWCRYGSLNPTPDWNELLYHRWGYVRLTAVNATLLDWQWVDSYSHEVVDHVIITQSDPSVGPWILPITDGVNSNSFISSDRSKLILILVFIAVSMFVFCSCFIFYRKRISLLCSRRSTYASILISTHPMLPQSDYTDDDNL